MKRWIVSFAVVCAWQSTIFAEGFVFSLTEVDKTVVSKVVEAFAKDSDQELINSAESLMPMALHLMSVPPLQTMAYVASDQELKQSLLKARGDLFKWGLFVRGFEGKMLEEKQTNSFWNDLKKFADYCTLDFEILEDLAQKNCWEEFVCYILEN